MEKTLLFDGKHNDYYRGRSNYSAGALPVLQQFFHPTAAAADIGCGTGIFSQLLIDAGFHVFGVDSDLQMLRTAEEKLSAGFFTAVPGYAENIPLPDKSIDLICAAQAFHWFDRAAFRFQCDRLLKTEGHILLIWNSKDTSSSMIKEYQDICVLFCGDRFSGFHNGLNLHGKEIPDFFHSLCKTFIFPNSIPYSRQKFLHWCLSSSYAPTKTHTNFAPFLAACQNLFDRYSVDDILLLPSETIIYIGK